MNHETIKLWLELISFVDKLFSNLITQLLFHNLRYENQTCLRCFSCDKCRNERVSKYIFTLESYFKIERLQIGVPILRELSYLTDYNLHIPNMVDISGALFSLILNIFILNSNYEEGAGDVNNIWHTGVSFNI